MTTEIIPATPRSGKASRSALALISGFIAVVVLSLVTDQMFRWLHVFPPLSQPMRDSRLLIAFGYRTVYAVLGAYIVARLAPFAPMGHVLISGAVGFVLSLVGAIAMWRLGSHRYPIALVLTALPTAWVGGVLHRKWHLSAGAPGNRAHLKSGPEAYRGA